MTNDQHAYALWIETLPDRYAALEVEHTQLQAEIERLRADNRVQRETIEAVYDALDIEPQLRSVERLVEYAKQLCEELETYRQDHQAMRAIRTGQVASVENYRGEFTAKGGGTQVTSSDPVEAIAGILKDIPEGGAK